MSLKRVRNLHQLDRPIDSDANTGCAAMLLCAKDNLRATSNLE